MKTAMNQSRWVKNIFDMFTTYLNRFGLLVAIYYFTLLALTISFIFFIPTMLNVAHAGKGFYSIQVGAFRDLDNALNMIKDLESSGHYAFYRHETIKGKGKWYRVYIERYGSKVEAERKGIRLKKMDLISNYIIKTVNNADSTLINDSQKYDIDNYSLHVGSYKEKSNAEDEVQRLRVSGYESFLLEEEISGKNWFRVYIGQFDDEKEARKAGSELRAKGMISYFRPKTIDKNIRIGKKAFLPETYEEKYANPKDKVKINTSSPFKREGFGEGEKTNPLSNKFIASKDAIDKKEPSNIGSNDEGRQVEQGSGVSVKSLPEELKDMDIKKNFIPSSFKRVGVIHALKGNVVVIHRATKEAYFGKEGDTIYENDSLNTLFNSRCRIKFFDEDIVTIAAKTEFSVESYVDERGMGKQKTLFSMLKGKAMFYAMRLFSYKDKRFRVKTPTLAIGVRGTKFGVHVYWLDDEKKADAGIKVADSGNKAGMNWATLDSFGDGKSYTDCFSEDGYIEVDGKIIGPGEMYKGKIGVIIPTPPKYLKVFESETEVKEEKIGDGEAKENEKGEKENPEEAEGGNEKEAEEEVMVDKGEDVSSLAFNETMENMVNITQSETGSATEAEQKTDPGLTKPYFGYVALLLQKTTGPAFYDVFLQSTIEQLDPHNDVDTYGINNSSDSLKYYQGSQGQDLVDANLAGSTRNGIQETSGDDHTVGQYSYTEWGYWMWSQPFIFQVGGIEYEGLNKLWWVNGNPTNDSVATGLNGVYNYSGPSYGTYSSLGGVSDMNGSFNCQVNFGTAQILDFNLNVSGNGHTATIQQGNASFSGNQFTLDGGTGTWLLDGVAADKKKAIGSFYGPEAQEIGGAWGMYITGPPSKGAGGIFAGQRQ